MRMLAATRTARKAHHWSENSHTAILPMRMQAVTANRTPMAGLPSCTPLRFIRTAPRRRRGRWPG